MSSFNIFNALIYQDENIVIINKPAGIRTIPDGYAPSLPNLKQTLHEEFGNIFTVHRLDKDTSGLVLFAKTREAHAQFNRLFEQRKIRKKYIALTHNLPNWTFFSMKAKLKTNGDRKHRTVVDPNGKNAHTDLYCTAKNHRINMSVVYCSLHSGYTHQIRSHLSSLGFPIIGDSLYKNLKDLNQKLSPSQYPIMALHAHALSFFDPEQNKRLCFTASPNKAFVDLYNSIVNNH